MAKIIVNTTFRDFDGTINDEMQIHFLKSLQKQTMQDFVLVVTIFNERKVERMVRAYMGKQCVFIYDARGTNYNFSLSRTFLNGIDYGLEHGADILLDCSADIILQKNFLEVVSERCNVGEAGISHPNVFMEQSKDGKRKFYFGKISRGIDARYFSLDLFQNEHIHELLNRFPSYDYGAGIEKELCCIAIKYASKRHNIFMESKVIKVENDRGGVSGKINAFMRKGIARNIPTVKRFLSSEGLSSDYLYLTEINKKFKVTRSSLKYHFMFLNEFIRNELGKRGFLKDYD